MISSPKSLYLKSSVKSIRAVLMGILLSVFTISSHAVDPKKISPNDDVTLQLFIGSLTAFYYAAKFLNLQIAAGNLVDALWNNHPSGESGEEDQATAQDPQEREGAVNWLAAYFNSDPENSDTLPDMPEALYERLNIDQYQLATAFIQANSNYRTPLEQLADEISALPLVDSVDEVDGRPELQGTESSDEALFLRTTAANGIELSQLTGNPGATLRDMLSSQNLHPAQNTLITLHAFLLQHYLRLRNNGALSEHQITNYRRSISYLVMVIHLMSQYSRTAVNSQADQPASTNWPGNEYISEVFDDVFRSTDGPETAFTVSDLDNGMRMAFGIIQNYRALIISQRERRHDDPVESERESALDHDANTVDTIARLDSLANHLVQDSDTPLSSLAYARNNLQLHTNAIMRRAFWVRTNTLAYEELDNFQIWHILAEMNVALQLVVLGQYDLARSAIQDITHTYTPLQSGDIASLPEANEDIIQWVFNTVDTVLESASEEGREVYSHLRRHFFTSVYALVVYTEASDHGQGFSDHQITRINVSVLNHLYELLLKEKDSSGSEDASEESSRSSIYLDARYAQFLRNRHERHQAVLEGNIIPGAKKRLTGKKDKQ
ncbi:hypothetical protein [Endozoicomonas lisbonensis]|uniref:Uncharacterized protein n=1 Tax=Endozoicomonas lisbonensis TaxID=3120522 RepID=A0ABV2SMT4_9GAMM